MFVSVLLDIPCTGSLQHRKEYAARCRTPRKSEKVMFAESGACDRSSAGSVSAKTDPQGTCRHQAKFQRSNKAYENTTPERIRSTPTPTTKFILMPMHLVRCLQLLPFSRIVHPMPSYYLTNHLRAPLRKPCLNPVRAAGSPCSHEDLKFDLSTNSMNSYSNKNACYCFI